MEFKNEKLSNGLVLIGEVNKSAKSAAVGFFVKTGSRDEVAAINGVSHYLEHMLFKGTEKLSALEVNEAFDRTGAQFNAFTSEENTVFYAAILPEYLVEVTQLWADLMRPSLRDEDFNIEKNVIKEEIAMYQDLPSFDVMDRCRTLHFHGHPCGNSVLGSAESIDGLTAEQMRDYFAKRYAPNNMVLACAGNFGWDQIRSLAADSCSKWPRQVVERKLGHFDGSKKKDRIEKANLAREHICLMSEGVSAQDPSRFAASLLGTIVGDDVGSRFFWELVDKALAEAASMSYGAMDGTGTFYSYIRCSNENVRKVLGIVRRVFDDIEKNGVTEDELAAAKNKILSTLVIKNELPMGRLIDLGFNWTYLEQYRTIEDDVAAIKGVTVGDVNTLIEQLSPGDFTQFSIGPALSS
ncbi:MAG: insulinase family protein [Planctomycetes bacterium]|nr:insulinase family protein [Planctomycetota bacterium]MBL7187193.1 insulinase family protein [Phycisphaerae bacterium]